MAEQNPDEVPPRPPDDERPAAVDLDATLTAVLRSVATRESAEEIVHLLPRPHPLDDRIRDESLKLQQALQAQNTLRRPHDPP